MFPGTQRFSVKEKIILNLTRVATFIVTVMQVFIECSCYLKKILNKNLLIILGLNNPLLLQ